MPKDVFQLVTVTRVFGDDVELVEVLGFPEVSALDDSEGKCRHDLESRS